MPSVSSAVERIDGLCEPAIQKLPTKTRSYEVRNFPRNKNPVPQIRAFLDIQVRRTNKADKTISNSFNRTSAATFKKSPSGNAMLLSAAQLTHHMEEGAL